MLKRVLLLLAVALIGMFGCEDRGLLADGDGPDKPGDGHDEPFECLRDRLDIDTTRSYVYPMSHDTLTIYPKAVFARFYPWVKDTAAIVAHAERHNLRLLKGLFGLDRQLAGVFCVADGRRAEHHFTPWGKQSWDNFGADSLVELCFGIF